MSESITILLVEDDEIDAEVITSVLRSIGSVRRIIRACDGQEALDMLRGAVAAGQERPSWPLVLLSDIKMPRMNGITFLEELRADPALQHLPAFMMSTSSSERDITRAYQLHISAYFTKASDMTRLTAIAHLIEEYCKLVELPARLATLGSIGAAA